MARRRIGGLSLICAAFLGTTALVLVGPVKAQSVGVTSATDGDPLGRPPSANERILRIGIDVQANEVVTTRANDRAHLVFLDGTSLTVGPNARLTVDKFVYDANSKTGELSVTASQGVFRLVGGKISKSTPIIVNTPSSTIGMRGGIGLFGVTRDRTMAGFLFGHSMRITGQGRTEILTRQGSMSIINTGSVPGPAIVMPPGGFTNMISQLEGGNASGSGGSGGNADQKAQSSGYSNSNSGQAHNLARTLPGTGLPPNVNNNTITTAVSNAGDQKQPQEDQTRPQRPTQPSEPKNTQTLKGFVSGLVVASTGEGSRTLAPGASSSKPGDLTITTNADAQTATATILVRDIDGRIHVPNSLSLQVGVPPKGASFFQDDQTFVMATRNGEGTVQLGDQTIKVKQTSVLYTAGALSEAEQRVGVRGPGSCTCEFLTFGYWATVLTREQQGEDGATRLRSTPDRAIIAGAPWVAGQVATQIPQTGSASFSGLMLGQAQNNGGALRNVQGSYGMSFDFGQRSGNFNASFDHRNYTGGVNGTGGANFSGNFTGSGYRVGNLGGAFYTGPGAGGGVVGQAGQFGIHGPGYLASGVFAGSRSAGGGFGSGR